ncbi:MAG: hypothetical protein II871_02920 [Clostridia bacterium]|nr:hypothetical protein [Clostridia bacterium]
MKILNKKPNIMTAPKVDGVQPSTALEQSEALIEHETDSAIAEASSRRSYFVRLFTYLVIPVFAAAFAVFVYFKGSNTAIGLIPPALSLLFCAAVTLRLIPAIVLKRDSSQLIAVGERSGKRLHPYFRIVFFSLIAQLLLLLTVYTLNSLINGFDFLLPEGHIKLFAQPRGLVFGENTRSIASSLGLLSFVLPQHIERLAYDTAVYIPLLAANSLAFAAASVLLYELVICDRSKRRAKLSVLLLHIMPTALLLLQPFGGTAFFFALSLLSLLFARKRRILAAGIAALAASLFNVFAVLLVVPIAIEWRIHSGMDRGGDDASEYVRIKTVPAVIGIILAFLPALAALILKLLGMSGLSLLEGNGAFHLNPIGGLLSEWNGGALPHLLIVISLIAMLLLAMLIFFGARHARTSHTAFALAFSILPAILTLDLASYSVFALPILASLIAEKCSFKAARTMTAIACLAVLLLFIVFMYVKRSA